MKTTTLRIALGCLVLAGCGSSTEPPPEYPPMDEPAATTTTTVEENEGGDEPPPPPPIQVVVGERTPIEGDRPTLRFRRPRDGQLIRRAPVNVRISVEHWELAAEPGNHVHLIVDDEPYMAIRDVSGNLDLAALVQEHLGHELAAGTHVLRTFASRSHHESVKDPQAFGQLVFHYQERTEDFGFDADAPHLVYSRPKGCNVAGSRVLLDFFLDNVEELSAEGHRVRYTIDRDVTGEITSWQPHYIENLPVGEHQLRLTLLGPDGEPVEQPFNDTTRTFSVAQSCEPVVSGAAEGADAGEEGGEGGDGG